MTLTAVVDFTDHSVLFREIHALVAGDLYNPLVLDFSRLPKATVDAINTSNLTLVLKRSQTGVTVASVPQFSLVPNHWALRSASLALTTQAVKDWFSALAQSGDVTVDTNGWIEVTDGTTTFVACPVPVVLRDITVRGDVSGYYTAAQVDALLADKQDDLTFDNSPSLGSTNPVTSNGIMVALNNKADAAATTAAIALKANASDVTTALAGKIGSAELTAALATYATTANVNAALALKADAATVTTALASKIGQTELTAALSSYATTASVSTSVSTAVANLATTAALNAAVSGLATTAALNTGLAAKADAATVTSALALKADASAIADMVTNASLETTLSSYATTASVNTAVSGKANSSDVTAALALKANASALALKADAATTYTKAEVDSLVSGASGAISFLDPTGVPVVIGGTTYGTVRLVRSVGGSPTLVVVDGGTGFSGTYVLSASNSWTATVGTATVSFAPATGTFSFTSGGTTVSASVTLPGSLGVLASQVADVQPADGHDDRVVSSGGVYDFVTAQLATKADSSAMTSALALKADATALTALATTVGTKADAATVTSALALKADASAVTEALALKANASDVTTALSAKANSSDMTTALAAKADATTVTALSTTVGQKADSATVTAALALKADATALALKADQATTYTKTEVDALVAGGGGGSSGGQPDVRFLDPTGTALTSGTTELGRLRVVSRSGNTVSKIVVTGTAATYAGTHVLTSANSWSSTSAGGGTVKYVSAASKFVFSYDGTDTEVQVTLPSSLGAPLSQLADVTPTDGNDDRAVSSGGTYDFVAAQVATRVSTTLHNEDLVATRLITAQNATSAAAAARGTTNNLNLLLAFESGIYTKAQVDLLLAAKGPAFTATAPLQYSNGVLSISTSGLQTAILVGGQPVSTTVDTAVTQGSQNLVTSGAVHTAIAAVSVPVTSVKLNGTALTPTAGAVDVQAVTGVTVNGTAATVTNGTAAVSAVTGVTVNGTAATVTNGVAAVSAITGATVNGTAATVTNGVVAITTPAPAGDWDMYECNDGQLHLNAINILDFSGSPVTALTIPEHPTGSGTKSRTFAVCMKNASAYGGSIESMTDEYTGSTPVVNYYSDWTDSSMTDFINNESTRYNSAVTRFYEVTPGRFTVMDIY